MAFHNIQCPHCFTDYTISDERYRATEGVMRCGTCREQFKAMLITEGQTPKFDPRDVFIEPFSEPLSARDGGEIEFSDEPEPSYVSYEKSVDPDAEADVELMSTHEFKYTEPKLSAPKHADVAREQSSSVSPDVLGKYGLSDELSTSEILQNLRKRAREDSAREAGGNAVESDESSALSLDIEIDNATLTQGQLDLELPTDSERSKTTEAKSEPRLDGDSRLINEVDKLVEQKLGRAPALTAPTLGNDQQNNTDNLHSTSSNSKKTNTSQTSSNKAKSRRVESAQTVSADSARSSNNDFLLEPRKIKNKKKSGVLRFVKGLLYLLLTITLIAALGYQLWLKQLINLPTDHAWFTSIEEKSAPYLTPLLTMADKKLNELGMELPQRRNLSQLKLLSASTEPHPTRPTTILLKISLINRADIAQPLPWLEMSLTDSDGRLVARRNLAPTDYIYNNQTDSSIGANELKKITIELLSFPKAATGYGIKLLNK